MHSSILRKGLGLIMAPLLFQLLFTGLLVYRQNVTTDAERWALHSKEVIRQGEALYRALMEADRTARGYVMTSEESFSKAHDEAVARISAQIHLLKGLVQDNPEQETRLDQLQRAADQYTAQLAELRQTTELSAHGQAIANLQTLFRKDPVGALRKDIDAFVSFEESLDRARMDDLHRIQKQRFWTLIAGGIILLTIGVAAAWTFSASIVRRLRVLNGNVRRLSAGEPLVPPVSGRDEISALDRSFHGMADGLAQAAAKEKLYQESLERRTAELTVTNRELSQKSDENEMFVYSVSHDLRSPLVNLQGFSKELGLAMTDLRELLEHDGVPATIREQGNDILEHGMAEPVHFIQTAVMRLGAIIDALLRLSRAGRVEYQRVQANVQSIVTRVVDATRSTMMQKGAKITVAPDLPSAWGDATVIEQVFANLIANALNYLDKNRPGVIEVSWRPDEQSPALVVYMVKDNGLGIPEAYLGKIFAIFQRVHGNVAPGEGIGLALVRRMVERHGGRIWVESQENVGSTFFVALPRSDPSATPLEPAPATPPPKQAPAEPAAQAAEV